MACQTCDLVVERTLSAIFPRAIYISDINAYQMLDRISLEPRY